MVGFCSVTTLKTNVNSLILRQRYNIETQCFPFSLSFFRNSFLLLAVGCDDPTAVDSKAVFAIMNLEILLLDPAFARNPQNIWPIQQLFNGLVQLDRNLNVVPEIAFTGK